MAGRIGTTFRTLIQREYRDSWRIPSRCLVLGCDAPVEGRGATFCRRHGAVERATGLPRNADGAYLDDAGTTVEGDPVTATSR